MSVYRGPPRISAGSDPEEWYHRQRTKAKLKRGDGTWRMYWDGDGDYHVRWRTSYHGHNEGSSFCFMSESGQTCDQCGGAIVEHDVYSDGDRMHMEHNENGPEVYRGKDIAHVACIGFSFDDVKVLTESHGQSWQQPGWAAGVIATGNPTAGSSEKPADNFAVAAAGGASPRGRWGRGW